MRGAVAIALAVVAVVVLAGCPHRRPAAPERDGFFVAVGAAGTILTSPDGTTWTVESSGSDEMLLGVAAGEGRVVVVGVSGTILASSDGVTWTQAAELTTGDLSDVIHDGTRFVAVGGGWQAGAVTLVSEDGSAWTQEPAPETHAFTDVVAGDGMQVALAWHLSDRQTSALFTNDGGADGWIKRFEAPGPGMAYNDVARSDDGVWVVVGSAFVLVSENGTAWAQHDLPEGASAWMRGVIHDGARFVAVGEAFTGALRAAVLTSVDGVTWSQAALLDGISLEAMAVGQGTRVAVGMYGAIVSSSLAADAADPAAWTTVTSPTTEHLTAVTWVDGN